MANLFGVDFKSLMASALGSQLYDATLTKATAGTYNVNDPTAGNQATTATYSCKAVPTKIEREYLDDSKVRHIGGEILVMLGTFSTPGIAPGLGDTITMVDPTNGSTLTAVVGKSSTDPAGATMTCRVD